MNYDAARQVFRLRLLGSEYDIRHPDFDAGAVSGALPLSGIEQILVLRFLCEARVVPATAGKLLSYIELPWGDLYSRNFNGRCILRAARTFGSKTQRLNELLSSKGAQLHAEKLHYSEAAWRFEIINGVYITFIIREGDDEFASTAQILFDDNMSAAFSAEDAVVASEIAIARLGAML